MNVPLNDPKFIDPLYRPYHIRGPNSYFMTGPAPPYPIVDLKRYENRHNYVFRSKHEGICPSGWRVGENNLCIPHAPESWGTFYTEKNLGGKLNRFSNNKIPYNECP